jgi:hypothetical protein
LLRAGEIYLPRSIAIPRTEIRQQRGLGVCDEDSSQGDPMKAAQQFSARK